MVGVISVTALSGTCPQRQATAPSAGSSEASVAAAAEPGFVSAPEPRPTSAPPSYVPTLLLASHLTIAFGCVVWLGWRALSACDVAEEHARLPLTPDVPTAAAPPAGVDVDGYLQDQTSRAGDFVILAHAAEDLQPAISRHDLELAVRRARESAPQLEHRQVAGRWILRRPRI
jgi:hypothetical protein